MSIKVFGMTGCTTVKKAQNWLADNGVAHDYGRYDRLDNLAGVLDAMIDASDLTSVLNTASQAFRKLDDTTQHALLADRAAAARLAVATSARYMAPAA